MTDATFEKINPSDNCLYGPRKLLICGFPETAQPKFKTLLQMIGLESLPLVWALSQQANERIAELFERQNASGEGSPSELPRTIIAAGITEKELIGLMSACKQSGMARILWATLTPTSEQWTLAELLTELAAERDALRK